MPWRVVVVEHLTTADGSDPHRRTGEVSVVQVLPPDAPDPTQQQLDAFAASFARFGGYATSRVLERYWYGYPVLTDVQQRAAAGLP